MAFAVAGTSPPIISFPLSMHVNGGSRTTGLINTVLEVEGILEEEATYPSLVLSVGFLWIDSIWWKALLQPGLRAADEEILHHAQGFHSLSPSGEWTSGGFKQRDQEDFGEDGEPFKERLVSPVERCIMGIPDSVQDTDWHVTLPYRVRESMPSACGVVAQSLLGH